MTTAQDRYTELKSEFDAGIARSGKLLDDAAAHLERAKAIEYPAVLTADQQARIDACHAKPLSERYSGTMLHNADSITPGERICIAGPDELSLITCSKCGACKCVVKGASVCGDCC